MENHSLESFSPRTPSTLTEKDANLAIADLLRGQLRVVARSEFDGRCLLLIQRRDEKPISSRDQEILTRTALGEPGKAIAIDLGVSASTVSARLTQLLEKIGVLSRAELTCVTALRPARLGPLADGASPWSAVGHGLARVDVGGLPHVLASFTRVDDERLQKLTPAEKDVVQAAVAGKTNLEIARARRTSPNTVANQLSRVYRKLNVGSRWALAGTGLPAFAAAGW